MENNQENVVSIKQKPKKKGLIITLSVIFILVLVGGYFVLKTLGVFPPKDIGISYTEKDFASVVEKTGINISVDGKSNEQTRDFLKDAKNNGEKHYLKDYDIVYSDFERKEFVLNSQEATAFINEVSPSLYCISNQQVKINKDGTVESSGTLHLKKAIEDFYPEMKESINFPLPDKVNLYIKSKIEIKDNSLSLDPEIFEAGSIKAVTPKMVKDNANFAEAIYKSMPGVMIYSFEVTDNGELAIDAQIPQKIIITKK